MANVIFKTGTREQYDALEQKDTSTLYWLEDTKEIRKGEDLYGTGAVATQTTAGLMSAVDKVKLDSLTPGTVSGLTPVDASIVIADGESGDKTIGVQISKESGNLIQLKGDGLFVGSGEDPNYPEYAIKKLDEASEGYSASYQLQKTVDGESTYVGDVINIPKDLVIQSGSVETVEEADVPYAGAQPGDIYIDLVLNDPDASHIYIPMKDVFGDVTELQNVIDSLPDEILSEIVNVQRTETTNTAEIRIFTKQADGTYSPEVKHGVITLIPAGLGPDGVTGAGLMSLADKQKLDSIDTSVFATKEEFADLESQVEASLTWTTI